MKYLLAMVLLPVGFFVFPKSVFLGVVLILVAAGILVYGLFTGDLPLFGSKR